ncbi:MAG: class I SAM-dependent methyltransferase [Patescibacteria group bacterium]
MKIQNYKLLDCGNQKKVEILGEYKVIRPCPQAIWKPFATNLWQYVDAEFVRENSEKGVWRQISKNKMKSNWLLKSPSELCWNITPNEFGNIGIFTEHWKYSTELISQLDQTQKVLSLFSYAGSNVMNLIKQGFKVTAVDSSKNAMEMYTSNIELNGLSRDGQRLILEDVYKFLAREIRREAKYGCIFLDAPSYGRGTKGEIFKIEEDLVKLLESAKQLITNDGYIVITLHSPRFTPIILEVLCKQIFEDKSVEVSEIIQMCESGAKLPSGFLVKVH